MTRLLPLLVLLAACADADAPAPQAPPPGASRPDATGPAGLEADSVRTYANDRFGYAVDLPAGLEAGPAPQNDDGRAFATADGRVEVAVYGFHDALDEGLDGLAAQAAEGIDDVTYQRRLDGGVVASGTSGDSTLYARGLLRDGVAVLARVEHRSGLEAGADVADLVGRTLRWTD